MNRTLPDSQLAHLSALLAASTGLHFPHTRWDELEQALTACAGELGCADAQSCVEVLLTPPMSKSRIEPLVNCLTIGETYFFRDPACFDILKWQVLPKLIDARRGSGRYLRIWSAGCSTGEEPYSVAMLLDTMIPDLHQWNVCILATDSNSSFLRHAMRGVYSNWSFRDVPVSIREAFFRQTRDGGFAIAPRIKAMVTFVQSSLAEHACLPAAYDTAAMDIILFRNVMMYWEPARTPKLVRKLSASLSEGGWLFVSPVEVPQVMVSQLKLVRFPGGLVYRKDSRPQSAERALGGRPDSASRSTNRAPSREPDPKRRETPSQMPPLGAIDARNMARLATNYANEGRLSDALAWCERALAGQVKSRMVLFAGHHSPGTGSDRSGDDRVEACSLSRPGSCARAFWSGYADPPARQARRFGTAFSECTLGFARLSNGGSAAAGGVDYRGKTEIIRSAVLGEVRT